MCINMKKSAAIAGLAAVMAAGAVIYKAGKNNRNKDEYTLWEDTASFYDLKFLHSKKLYNKIIEMIGEELTPDMKVLELAASTGVVARGISKYCGSIIASDFSERMIARAKAHGTPTNLLWDVQDAEFLTYPEESFDAVVIVNALDTMTNPEAVMEQVYRVLNPGGLFIAPGAVNAPGFVSNTLNMMKSSIGYGSHSYWDYEEYVDMFEDYGFEVVRAEIMEGRQPVSFVVAMKSE